MNVGRVMLITGAMFFGVSSSQAETLVFQCSPLEDAKPVTFSVDVARNEVSWSDLEQIEKVSVDDRVISFRGFVIGEFWIDVLLNRKTGLLSGKIGLIYKHWQCQ